MNTCIGITPTGMKIAPDTIMVQLDMMVAGTAGIDEISDLENT